MLTFLSISNSSRVLYKANSWCLWISYLFDDVCDLIQNKGSLKREMCFILLKFNTLLKQNNRNILKLFFIENINHT